MKYSSPHFLSHSILLIPFHLKCSHGSFLSHVFRGVLLIKSHLIFCFALGNMLDKHVLCTITQLGVGCTNKMPQQDLKCSVFALLLISKCNKLEVICGVKYSRTSKTSNPCSLICRNLLNPNDLDVEYKNINECKQLFVHCRNVLQLPKNPTEVNMIEANAVKDPKSDGIQKQKGTDCF